MSERKIIKWGVERGQQWESDTDWVVTYDTEDSESPDALPYTASKGIDWNGPIKNFETLDAAMAYCQRVYDAVNGEDPVADFIDAANALMNRYGLSDEAYSALDDLRDEMLMWQDGGK